jgi:polysaccharide pyruvyl transferase WcaK-like protein
LAAGRSVKVLLPGKGQPWPDVDPDLVVSLPHLFSRRVGEAERTMIDSLGAGDRLIVIGADTLDGTYASSDRDRHLALALAASARGAAVDVVSFSLRRSGDRSNLLRLVFKVADRVVARDVLSMDLCREVYGRSALVAPDAAFLVPSPLSGPGWKVDGPLVMNLSAHAECPRTIHSRKNADDLATVLADGVAMESHALPVLTIPHDVRTGCGDLDSLLRLEAALKRAGLHATRPPNPHPGPSEVRQLLSGSSLVITGRMHLAIAAMSVGIPVIGLSYHDKWEGLWDLFDLPSELLLDVRTAEADQIAAACRFARDHGSPLSTHINERSRRAAATARLQAGTAL